MCSLFPLGLCTPGTDIHLTESELNKAGEVKEAWRESSGQQVVETSEK